MHANVARWRHCGINYFFVFKMLPLPKSRVKYYDYVVMWCNCIACNWCVSLDIALILDLTCLNDSHLLITITFITVVDEKPLQNRDP